MSEQHLTRAALARPSTANDESRTVELVVATEADPGDGYRLSLRQMPDHADVLPVLLSHRNDAREMAGRLRSLRIERGQLIGLAEFRDAPASEDGWAMARAGSAVSVGATFEPDAIQRQADGTALVQRWRLREASLVPIGADPLAITRSATPTQPLQPLDSMTDSVVATEDQQPEETAIERAAMRCELVLRRSASEAQLPADVTDRIVAEYRHRPKVEGITAIVRTYRERVEERAPVYAGHPARVPLEAQPGELETAFQRALSGQALDKPLVMVLREHGYTGRSAGEILQRALTQQSPERWLSRGFHSTSDAASLFIETGDRQLQARYAEPVRGITRLARIRQLADFRAASVIDVALVGQSKRILEGGEIQFATMNDESTTYKPYRHGLGFSFSYESLANDDLAAVAAVLDEASQTGLEAEADDLVTLLTEGSDGANGPDGLPLFHSSRNNSTTAAMTAEGLGEAVKLLRQQTTIGGRRLSLEPGFLVVGPEMETAAAQLLSGLYQPTDPETVNPWRNLELLVEPGIEDTNWFVAARGPRAVFELGRVVGFPMMRQEEMFSTSATRIKIESAHGCAIADPRSIVRCILPSS